MKAAYSERAGRSLRDLPPDVRKAFLKQVKYLERNLRHPSLRAKKYDESHDLWQARVTNPDFSRRAASRGAGTLACRVETRLDTFPRP